MSWARIDDSMPDDDKVANLSDAAFRAYVSSICFSARMLTDGSVPKQTAHKLIGRRHPQVVTELAPMLWHERGDLCVSESCAKAGLCTLAADKYLVHNYLKYNPTRKDVLEKRAKDLQRKGYGNGHPSS